MKLVQELDLESVGEARIRRGTGEAVPAKLYRLDMVQFGGLTLPISPGRSYAVSTGFINLKKAS